MRSINKNNVTYIESVEKEKSNRFKYIEDPDGNYIEGLAGKVYHDLPLGMYLKENQIYNNPYIVIHFNDKTRIIQAFSSCSLMESNYRILIKSLNLIDL